ncbi:MAG: DUF983 domain-containing protein [Pseudomonadota bacterium]
MPDFPHGAALREPAKPPARPHLVPSFSWRAARGEGGYPRPIYATNGFNPPRPVPQAMAHGWNGLCPCCGKGGLFQSYLDLNDRCPACGEPFSPARVANATPLVAIPVALGAACLVAGVLEMFGGMRLWAELLLCELIGLTIALWVLPKAKGMLVGYAWACHIGGFDPLRHLVPDPEGHADTAALSAAAGCSSAPHSYQGTSRQM